MKTNSLIATLVVILTLNSSVHCFSRDLPNPVNQEKFDIELIEESIQNQALKGQNASYRYKIAVVAAYSMWWLGLIGLGYSGKGIATKVYDGSISSKFLLIPSTLGMVHGSIVVHSGKLDAKMVDKTLQKKSKSYLQILTKGEEIIEKGPLYEQIRIIFESIKLNAENLFPETRDFDWEFVIVKDDSNINAFCLPGGKIAIYTGMIAKSENEAALAAIIGHELGHAVSMHAAKRQVDSHLSSSLIDILKFLASSFLGKFSDFVVGSFGLLFHELPFSRTHEFEADKIGLVLMSKAGYDPNEAIEFWHKMASKNEPSSIISTHPNSLERCEAMKIILDDVMNIYEKSPEKISKDKKLNYQITEKK